VFVAAPTAVLYVPATQLTQTSDEAPTVALYLPATQSVHEAADVPPTTVRNLPAAHNVHTETLPVLHEPAAQFAHTLESVLKNWPEEHEPHAAEPEALKVPAPHAAHELVAELAARNVFMAQLPHDAWSAAWKVPAGQKLHRLVGSLATRNVPMGHVVQTAVGVARCCPPTQSGKPVPVRKTISETKTHYAALRRWIDKVNEDVVIAMFCTSNWNTVPAGGAVTGYTTLVTVTLCGAKTPPTWDPSK
jgi:hypothetical protein